jgi:hypothetical protein
MAAQAMQDRLDLIGGEDLDLLALDSRRFRG